MWPPSEPTTGLLRRPERPNCAPSRHATLLALLATACAAGMAADTVVLKPRSSEDGVAAATAVTQSNESTPLLLSALLREGRVAEARARSRIEVDGTFLGHSGFLAVNSTSGRVNQLFFWLQPCTDGCDPSTAPFIQWFNGGPGSPDTIGALNQIGTHYVDAAGAIAPRCFTWCRASTCLFVDSPVETGFSYQELLDSPVEYTATSREATEQVLHLLLQIYQIFPEYRSAPYYIHGLSYGGRYVPYMAKAVLSHNRDHPHEAVDLRGIAVGDPIIDNAAQNAKVAPALAAFGLLMEDEAAAVAAIMANATALAAVSCEASFREWNRVFNDDGGSSCAPFCDFLFAQFTGSTNTEHALLGAQPASFGRFRPWLRDHASALHAAGSPAASGPNVSFSEGGEVYAAMVASGDFCASTARLYAELLLDSTPPIDVLVYSGNLDPLLGARARGSGRARSPR